jgi:hypothetical protein
MNALSSPGGRIVILVVLVIVGLAADRLGVPFAKDMVLTTLATLLAVLAGRPSGTPSEEGDSTVRLESRTKAVQPKSVVPRGSK